MRFSAMETFVLMMVAFGIGYFVNVLNCWFKEEGQWHFFIKIMEEKMDEQRNNAIAKINDEMQKDPANKYLEAVGHYVIDKCGSDKNAEAVLDEKKTLKGCMDAVMEEARKQAKNGVCVMADEEVYSLVDKYFSFTGEESIFLPSKGVLDLADFL